jgi:hypothetical protein
LIKFDILKKLELPDSKIRRSGFYSCKMVKISMSRLVLCISQVELISMLWTYFLDDLDGFHSRNKEVHGRKRVWIQTERFEA